MYVILFYDIANRDKKKKDNSRAIRKSVEKYLSRVQFSVFEGEILPSDLKKLKESLLIVLDKNLDSIIIYESKKPSYTDRIVLGIDKNEGNFW